MLSIKIQDGLLQPKELIYFFYLPVSKILLALMCVLKFFVDGKQTLKTDFHANFHAESCDCQSRAQSVVPNCVTRIGLLSVFLHKKSIFTPVVFTHRILLINYGTDKWYVNIKSLGTAGLDLTSGTLVTMNTVQSTS